MFCPNVPQVKDKLTPAVSRMIVIKKYKIRIYSDSSKIKEILKEDMILSVC